VRRYAANFAFPEACITCVYIGYSQKNGAILKVNKKSIYHLTRVKRTPPAAVTTQVSHVLLTVRFSCLLRGQFPSKQVSKRSELLVAHEKLGQLLLLTVYVLPT
jgi:hypothetical protein